LIKEGNNTKTVIAERSLSKNSKASDGSFEVNPIMMKLERENR